MKNKIGMILLIIFFLLISVGSIIFSIPILEREITDLEEYIYAINMFVTGVFTLSVIISPIVPLPLVAATFNKPFS